MGCTAVNFGSTFMNGNLELAPCFTRPAQFIISLDKPVRELKVM
jgi:hypothetical protein